MAHARSVSAYGFLGALKRKREWVEWFYELIWYHIWINVILGIWWLVTHSTPYSRQFLQNLW